MKILSWVLVSSLFFFSPVLFAKINLNEADVNALSHSTPGIGDKRAEAIVAYREAHGNFSAVEDLAKVPSFGPNFVKNRLGQFKKVFEIGG